MRLGELIQKKILTGVGGKVAYRFGGSERRHTLFSEDILAEYAKECQNAGFGEQMREIGEGWLSRLVSAKMPNYFKKIPQITFLNYFLGRNLANIGLIESLRASRNDNVISLEIKKEGVTRIVGRNDFLMGLHQGVIEVLNDRKVKPVKVEQTKEGSHYEFEILEEPFTIDTKPIRKYNELNTHPQSMEAGLEELLRKKIFTLRGNRMYFRGKSIGPVENTVFHLFGQYGLCIDRVSHISFDYFNELVDKDSSIEGKLSFLKTFIQATGWGIVNMLWKPPQLTVTIKHPPYGLQPEGDNWTFLANTILGYLWIVDKSFKIEKISEDNRKLIMNYATVS
jgi:hypothetical protein